MLKASSGFLIFSGLFSNLFSFFQMNILLSQLRISLQLLESWACGGQEGQICTRDTIGTSRVAHALGAQHSASGHQWCVAVQCFKPHSPG